MLHGVALELQSVYVRSLQHARIPAKRSIYIYVKETLTLSERMRHGGVETCTQDVNVQAPSFAVVQHLPFMSPCYRAWQRSRVVR